MCFRIKVSLLLLALFVGAGVFSMSVAPIEAVADEYSQDSTVTEAVKKPIASDKAANFLKYIEQLKAKIAALQAKLKSAHGQQQDGEWCHTFNRDLKYGNNGAEAIALQAALKKQGFTGVSRDKVGRFGVYTASAVVGFQEKYRKIILDPLELKYGTGFVGKSTRAKLNLLYGCGIIPVPPTPVPPVPPVPPISFDKPYCGEIGSKSQGWYQNIGADRPEFIRWDNNCQGCVAVCKAIGSRSEGWYSSCDGELIKYDNCGVTPVPPIPPVVKCTDSDGGINKYVKGTTCRNLYLLKDSEDNSSPTTASSSKKFCRTDKCIARNIMPAPGSYNTDEDMLKRLKMRDSVIEYYCRGNKIFSKIMRCENGCENGACLKDSEEPVPVCEDKCGDGICQATVCLGTGCPCAETPESCPADCANQECAAEGESAPVVPDALECCEGLSKISCAEPDSEGVCPEEPCVGASICANCGNGTCGLGENKCNCPEDCEDSQDTTQ